MAFKATAVEEGPELLEMPPDEEIGIFEKFVHPQGWIRDRIIVFQQEGTGGAEPLYPSVNGFTLGIPREMEVDIPRPFVEDLEHAVIDHMEQAPDGTTKIRKVSRHPWRLIERGVNLKELKDALQKEIARENRRRQEEYKAQMRARKNDGS